MSGWPPWSFENGRFSSANVSVTVTGSGVAGSFVNRIGVPPFGSVTTPSVIGVQVWPFGGVDACVLIPSLPSDESTLFPDVGHPAFAASRVDPCGTGAAVPVSLALNRPARGGAGLSQPATPFTVTGPVVPPGTVNWTLFVAVWPAPTRPTTQATVFGANGTDAQPFAGGTLTANGNVNVNATPLTAAPLFVNVPCTEAVLPAVSVCGVRLTVKVGAAFVAAPATPAAARVAIAAAVAAPTARIDLRRLMFSPLVVRRGRHAGRTACRPRSSWSVVSRVVAVALDEQVDRPDVREAVVVV